MAIRDDWTQLNDASTSGDWTTSGFDSPTLNNASSTVPYFVEGDSCQNFPMKKGQTDGHTYDNNFGTEDFTGMLFVFWYWLPAPEVANIPLDELWVQISSDTTFTGNMGAWDALPFLAANPGSFIPLKVYPTNPDETAGTLVVNSVDSVGFRATTGGDNDGKAAAFDHCFVVSEMGGHSETWTNNFFTDIVNDANGDLAKVMGVFRESGDFYNTNVNIAIGNDVAANTSVTETSKTVFFDNIQPEQELGYIFYGGSTGQVNVTLTSVTHFWNSQLSTHEIFSQVDECDIFRVDGSSFSLGGAVTLAAHISDANTYVKNSTFTACYQIDANTMMFQDNEVLASLVAANIGAMLLSNEFTTSRQKDINFTRGANGHALELDSNVASAITLTGFAYDGYNATTGSNLIANSGPTDAAIYNNSGKEVTVTISGGGDVPSVRNGAGATTIVIAATSVTLTGMKDNTEVRVYSQAGVELAGIEDAIAGTTDDRSFTFSLEAALIVNIAVFNIAYILPPNNAILGFTIPSTDTSIPLAQVPDRNYENPP